MTIAETAKTFRGSDMLAMVIIHEERCMMLHEPFKCHDWKENQADTITQVVIAL